MPLMQEDIRKHYELTWKQMDDTAQDEAALAYSNPIEDGVLYRLYERLLNDLKILVSGGKVLDVGAGSGRWIRFFTRHFTPALLMGVDFTEASIELLKRRYGDVPRIKTAFRTADLTDPSLDLGEKFDLINVMNVLFHIPEPDRFTVAMKNLANHLAPGGRVVTTEYMPRQTMRTNWMLVRSRYEMESRRRGRGDANRGDQGVWLLRQRSDGNRRPGCRPAATVLCRPRRDQADPRDADERSGSPVLREIPDRRGVFDAQFLRRAHRRRGHAQSEIGGLRRRVRESSRGDFNSLAMRNLDNGSCSERRLPLGFAASHRLDSVIGAGAQLP